VVFNFKTEGRDKKIFLAGSFNDWQPSDAKFLMKDDDGDGIWSITVKLAPGSYQYKYVIDGKWTQDPYGPEEAADGFGGRNSKFEVK
jgi:1,4-alpha-glucan branching enzyme